MGAEARRQFVAATKLWVGRGSFEQHEVAMNAKKFRGAETEALFGRIINRVARLCLLLAAVASAGIARGDMVLQQYAPTSTTMTARSPKDGSQSYSDPWVGNNRSTTGESVYLPGSGTNYTLTGVFLVIVQSADRRLPPRSFAKPQSSFPSARSLGARVELIRQIDFLATPLARMRSCAAKV
jgi:hypothetical protein